MNLCTLGHVADRRTLVAHGWTRATLDGALRDGSVVRLRRGTYGCAHLDGASLMAARVGGPATCVSVLRSHGVWAGHDRRLHVQLPANSPRPAVREIRAHRSEVRFGGGTMLEASRMQSLWQAMHCLDEENAIAAMESAIKQEFLTEVEVRRLGAIAPRRLQGGIRLLAPNSGSGNETIVRLRLHRVGYRVVAQGKVPGLGHQDVVVEDCVGLEIDSHEWHEDEEQRATDANRDLQSEGLGRHVLRIRPHHVHESWPHTLTVIDRAVADARRLRR